MLSGTQNKWEELCGMYQSMGISRQVYEFGESVAEELKERFQEIDRVAEYNQCKVLKAMQEEKVEELVAALDKILK